MAEDLTGTKVWARRPFGYAGREIAQGEIFELGGYANDALLVRFRYVEEVPKFKKHHEHGATGRKFIEGGYLDAFGRTWKREKEDLTMVESGYGMIDTTGDAEERRLNAEAPLDLSR